MTKLYENISSDVFEKQKTITYKQYRNENRYKYKEKALFFKTHTIEKKESYQVVGYLKTENKKMTGDRIILFPDSKREFPVINKKPKFYQTIGYIQVGKTEYIAVIRKSYLIFILILLLLLMLLWILFGKHIKTPVIDDSIGDIINSSEPDMNGTITFPGFDSVYDLGKDDCLYMTNPKENDVYFEYSIVNANNNTEVYKSDMVPPDKSLPVKLYELLGSGTSNIKICINTYDIDTMQSCTPFIYNNIKVSIQ